MKSKVIAWLDAAPPGVIIYCKDNIRLRKELRIWTCTSAGGGYMGMAGREFTSDQLVKMDGIFTWPGPAQLQANQWKNRAGQVIQITDMDDTHLVNTTKFLRRNLVNRVRSQDRMRLLFADSDDMGEHAYDAVEDELLDIDDLPPEPLPGEFAAAVLRYQPRGQIQNLVDEVTRRKLHGQFGEESFITDLQAASA